MHETDIRSRDFNLLRLLLALLETGGVSAAADRAGLSQPAMSRALARLRDEFGDPLLVRTRGGMARTPRAEALIEPLRAVLAAAATLYRGEEFDPATADRVFRAAMPDVIAATMLPRIVALMQAEAPGCRLDIVPWAIGSLPGAGAQIDFAISCEPQLYRSMRMDWLFDDQDVLAVRSGRGGAVAGLDARAMAALPHVAVATPTLPQDPVDRWLAKSGLERNIVVVVPHYLQAIHLIARTDLSAILPRRLCDEPGISTAIAAFDIPLAPSPDRQWLFYPATAEADPASKWLRALVKRAASPS